MEQAGRFFRYVVPGLTLIIEFLGYLLISGDICFSQLIYQLNAVGIAASALLVSGGLGFLLGVFYYIVVWREKYLKKILTGVNFRSVLEKAVSEGWLRLCYPNGDEVQATKLAKRDAWRVVTSYLSMRMETSVRIKGAFPRMERFADLVNGLGTTCLGSFVALMLFLCVNIYRAWPGQFSWWGWVSFLMGSGILIIHHCNYRGVIKDYENVVDAILLNEFECEYYSKSILGSPIKLHVFQNDLKKECLKPKDK